jgi:hypothetical protein
MLLGRKAPSRTAILSAFSAREQFPIWPLAPMPSRWKTALVLRCTQMIHSDAPPPCLPREGRDPVLPWALVFAGVTGFVDMNLLNGPKHWYSDLNHAAIDEQLYARDVGAVVRAEEYRRLAQIVRCADPAERNRSDGRCFLLVSHEMG